MNYSDFIASFPEFGSRDQALVERTISQVLLECNGYSGISDIQRREMAILLLVAHTIKCELRDENPLLNGVIKKVESRNDSVEFATGEAGGFNLESTQYGVRLEKLLISCYP